MVAFWKRFLWLLAVNAVINRVLCVEVPLSQNCSLGGSKQLSFGHPQSTTTHTDRQTLNILPTAEFESVTLSKSETRDHTRSNYSEDLLEQSSMTNSLKSDTRGPKMSVVRNSTHTNYFKFNILTKVGLSQPAYETPNHTFDLFTRLRMKIQLLNYFT